MIDLFKVADYYQIESMIKILKYDFTRTTFKCNINSRIMLVHTDGFPFPNLCDLILKSIFKIDSEKLNLLRKITK